MNENLKKLIELQELDLVIKGLEETKEFIPRELAEHEENVKKAIDGVNSIKEEIKNSELERKKKEGKLEQNEVEIDKLQTQLYELKSNEAYQTMELEINNLKGENSEIENAVLEILEKQDQLNAKLKEAQQKQKDEEAKLADKQRENKEKIKEVETGLAKKGEERSQKVSQIDGDILSRYDRVRLTKEGVGIVAVQNEACMGCHTNIIPQKVNELMKGDKVLYCERCSRILYLKEQ